MTPSAPADHDQFFKTLFKTFFPELFQLFFSPLADGLLLEQATFLDKEYFTDFPIGKRRTLDLLARVPCRDPSQAHSHQTVLLHTETQEEDSPEPIDQRLFRYALTLQARHFPEPVTAALVRFATHEVPIAVDVFCYEALGSGLSLKYHRVAIKSLSAEEYLDKDNPLGWALAARMKRGQLSKVMLALRCLARIVRARLSDVKKELLLNCVKGYIKLTEMEQVEMQEFLKTEEFADVKEVELTWSQQLRKEGWDEGRKEERKEMLLKAAHKVRDTFARRFGDLPAALDERLKETGDMDRLFTCLDEIYQAPDRAVAEASLHRLFTTH